MSWSFVGWLEKHIPQLVPRTIAKVSPADAGNATNRELAMLSGSTTHQSKFQARGNVTIQNMLMIKTVKAMASTTIRGPNISNLWPRAVSRRTVARKTLTFT